MATERAERWDKIDLKPKRWWGYTIFLFILGTILPPLAVAARFGIGKDFFINVFLTLCGYIPGHVHNFYIQNIRNNKSDRRTPKWAQRYGLIDMTALERRRKRAQWANRYNDRAPRSAWEGAEYAEGQEPGGSSVDLSNENTSNARSGTNGDLWRQEDERYYSSNENRKSQGRWHYPANFDDAIVDQDTPRKKSKKDRWARTEDAYVREAEASERRKRKKSKKKRSTVGESDTHSRASGSTTEFPEDAEGGLYGDRTNANGSQPAPQDRTKDEDVFNHQF